MPEFSGRCLCGAVTWRSVSPKCRNLICHCESCRRATSSAFGAFIGFAPDDVTWHGQINHYESSPGNRRGFCPACGSRLYFRSERWPGEIHIHAATLDDDKVYEPDAHVVWSERVHWITHDDALPKHDGFGQAPKEADK